MNDQNEISEAQKYGLSVERYREFSKLNLLRKCVPLEGATCGSAEGILNSLLDQYNVDDLMNLKNPEHKKGKELFLSCLFAYILRHLISNEMSVCIPTEDRGIDIYIREIDENNKKIILKPIQICEFPEFHIKTKTEDFTLKIFEFIKSTKFKYAKSHDALLLWLEPEENNKLDIKKLRELFQKEKTIPFTQIIIFGKNNNLFNVCCAYSRDPQNYFCFEYDWQKDEIIKD